MPCFLHVIICNINVIRYRFFYYFLFKGFRLNLENIHCFIDLIFRKFDTKDRNKAIKRNRRMEIVYLHVCLYLRGARNT